MECSAYLEALVGHEGGEGHEAWQVQHAGDPPRSTAGLSHSDGVPHKQPPIHQVLQIRAHHGFQGLFPDPYYENRIS